MARVTTEGSPDLGPPAERVAVFDNDVQVLLGGILQAFAGMDVETYRPMVELLGFLAASGFTSYIASGGDRDCMRPVTEAIYGIPSERVIGSSNALRYQPDGHGGSIVYLAEPDVFDDAAAPTGGR